MAGTFDMRGKQFFQPAKPVSSWGVIVFEDANRFGNEQVKSALELLSKAGRVIQLSQRNVADLTLCPCPQACGELGLRLPINPLPALVRRTAQDGDVRGAFRELLQRNNNKKPDLVVCFIAPKNTHYALIKQFGDLQNGGGVATQCLNTGASPSLSGTTELVLTLRLIVGKLRKLSMAYFGNVALKVILT